MALHWGGWEASKFAFYDKNGITDSSSQDSNHLPYRPGNAAIRIEEIRNVIKAQGKKLPEDLKRLFQ